MNQIMEKKTSERKTMLGGGGEGEDGQKKASSPKCIPTTKVRNIKEDWGKRRRLKGNKRNLLRRLGGGMQLA